MTNRICIYAIAKNEEKFVDTWYESMKEADAIVVLDTGSTDRTVEKLRAHGVTVKEKHYDFWRFDVGRNDSLDLIPDDCNICFTTDLDEKFEPGWADIIRNEWIEGKHTRATYSYYTGDEEFEQSLNWCHSKEWRWKFPCHEAMARDKSGIWYYPDETLNLRGRVKLRHYPDRSKGRSYYIDLLKIRKEENPDDAASAAYYMRELTYVKDWAGIIAMREDVEAPEFEDRTADKGAMYKWIGDAYSNTEDHEAANEYYRKSISTNERDRAAYIALAQNLIQDGKHQEGKDVLIECLKKSVRDPSWTWVDSPDLWEWKAYDWLCVADYWMGNYDAAAGWAHLALAGSPGNIHVLKNLKVSERKLPRR